MYTNVMYGYALSASISLSPYTPPQVRSMVSPARMGLSKTNWIAPCLHRRM